MEKLADKGDESPSETKISPAGGKPGQPGTDSRQESPTFATADPSASVSEMNDYVAIHGGIGGALIPPGTSLEELAREDHTREANDVEHHLKLVQKSPPAPFLGVRPNARSPTTARSGLTKSTATPSPKTTLRSQTKSVAQAKAPRLSYQELLQKLQTPELFQVYLAQTKEQELFNVVFDSEPAKWFRPRMARKGKDLGVAENLEKKGYAHFVEKNYAEAMRYYNHAALVAPQKSELLGLIYCHRSAISFLWGDYENCLDDINRSLNFELPQKTRRRLEFRKAKCEILLRMNSPTRPQGSSDDTEAHCADESNKIRKTLKAVTTEDPEEGHDDHDATVTSRQVEAVKLKKTRMRQPVPPRLTGAPSAKVATASNRLDCTYSEESGRHFVAAVNIEPGDILAVEEPYAKICVPNYWKTHCQQCLKRCGIVIPCNSCSLVCFCSERCQDSATVYHSIECTHILDLRLMGENSGTLLAYRMFTQEGVEFFRRWAPVLSQIDNFPRHNLIFGHKTRIRNFPAVYTTLTHVWEKNPMVSFRAAAAAVYLVKSLDEASYFARSPKSKEEDKKFIGQLLFHTIMAVSSNFFSLPENQPLRTISDITTVPEVGSGFFPNASLFNHSCFPEAMHYFIGNHLVCRALLPVEPGEEVHISYGKYFYCDSKPERQSWLAANYYFVCTCAACKLDWRPFHELSDDRRLKCPICETGHENVEEHFDGEDNESRYLREQWKAKVESVEALERRFFRIKRRVDRGVDLSAVKRAIPVCLEFMKTLYELYECPNKTFLHLYDFVGDMYQLEPYSAKVTA